MINQMDEIAKGIEKVTINTHLGVHSGGDKSSLGNNYTHVYDSLFEPLRDKSFNFLEIGVFRGDSMHLFDQYFTQAKLYGVDISYKDYRKLTHQWIRGEPRLDICNSRDPNQVKAYGERVKCFFKIIIDDGDHHPRSQIATFEHFFFNLLESGGIYVIEDVGGHAGPVGPAATPDELKKSVLVDGVRIVDNHVSKKRRNIIISYFTEILYKLLSGVSRKMANIPSRYRQIKDKQLRQIESVSFHPGLIIIRKR